MEELGDQSCLNYSQIKRFELGYWLMALDCVISFSLSFTLVAIGNEMLQTRFKFTSEEASFYITSPYFIVAFLMPLIGYVSDILGRRQTIIVLGGIIKVSAYAILFGMPDCDRCFIGLIPFF